MTSSGCPPWPPDPAPAGDPRARSYTTPGDTILGVTHNQLGNVYEAAGNVDLALHHYRQAIRYAEHEGDVFSGGIRRSNVAILLLKAGSLDEARAYAEAALANFSTFGDRAAADIEKTKELIAVIYQEQAQQESDS